MSKIEMNDEEEKDENRSLVEKLLRVKASESKRENKWLEKEK
jgi:hypothetical protein